MEVKVQLGYEQVIALLKQLPKQQLDRLMDDLKQFVEIERPKASSEGSFAQFLLAGPTMSEKQYETFLENRKLFNQWR